MEINYPVIQVIRDSRGNVLAVVVTRIESYHKLSDGRMIFHPQALILRELGEQLKQGAVEVEQVVYEPRMRAYASAAVMAFIRERCGDRMNVEQLHAILSSISVRAEPWWREPDSLRESPKTLFIPTPALQSFGPWLDYIETESPIDLPAPSETESPADVRPGEKRLQADQNP